MKKILLFVLSVLGGLTAYAGDVNFQWAKTVTAPMGTNAHSLAKSADGKIFALANFGSSGSNETVLYDGELTGTGAPYSGSSSAGNLNIVFQKLEKDGTLIWSINSCWGGASLSDCAYTPTADGGAFLALKFYHTNYDSAKNGKLLSLTDADGETTDVIWEYPGYWVYQGILVKVSTDGKIEWTKLIDMDYSPEANASSTYKNYTPQGFFFYGAAEDGDGNLYIAGNYRKEMTFVKENSETVVLTPHNTEGWTGDPQSTIGDLFLVKLDKYGNYLGHITTTGTAARESINDIAYAGGKIYFLGMVKGASSEDSEITLGNYKIQPTKFDDILVGAVNTDMTIAWINHFPAFAASNAKHTTLNKKMDIQNGSLYLMGHVIGGFGKDKTEALIESTSTMQAGFLIKCSAADGTWQGGVVHDATISGYYGAFEDKEGKLYAYGYCMGSSIFLTKYDATTWTKETQYDLITGGGSATAWGCLLDEEQFLSFSRAGAKSTSDFIDNSFTIGAMNDAGSWISIISSFEIPGLELATGVSISEASQEQAVKVHGGKEQIFIEAGKTSEIQILNTYGQVIKNMSVSSGKQAISMPKGIYIINKNKVVVY